MRSVVGWFQRFRLSGTISSFPCFNVSKLTRFFKRVPLERALQNKNAAEFVQRYVQPLLGWCDEQSKCSDRLGLCSDFRIATVRNSFPSRERWNFHDFHRLFLDATCSLRRFRVYSFVSEGGTDRVLFSNRCCLFRGQSATQLRSVVCLWCRWVLRGAHHLRLLDVENDDNKIDCCNSSLRFYYPCNNVTDVDDGRSDERNECNEL